jgi:hypothetical protein
MGLKFGDATSPLLFSVRSGAAVSLFRALALRHCSPAIPACLHPFPSFHTGQAGPDSCGLSAATPTGSAPAAGPAPRPAPDTSLHLSPPLSTSPRLPHLASAGIHARDDGHRAQPGPQRRGGGGLCGQVRRALRLRLLQVPWLWTADALSRFYVRMCALFRTVYDNWIRQIDPLRLVPPACGYCSNLASLGCAPCPTVFRISVPGPGPEPGPGSWVLSSPGSDVASSVLPVPIHRSRCPSRHVSQRHER